MAVRLAVRIVLTLEEMCRYEKVKMSKHSYLSTLETQLRTTVILDEICDQQNASSGHNQPLPCNKTDLYHPLESVHPN